MYQTKAKLVLFFNEMLNDVDKFKRNTYIEEERNEECCDLYMQMVNNLKKTYLYS